MTQRRPKGPEWPIDAQWKESVIAALRERGWTQADLARAVGVTPAGISYLLSGSKTWQSRLVPAVHEALGWPAPSSTAPSNDLDDIRRLWVDLTPEQRLLVQSLAEQLSRKR